MQADDRIARIEKNAPDYFQLAFAASKINAVLVDVNWRLAGRGDAPDRRRRRRQAAVRRHRAGRPGRQGRGRAGHACEQTILLGDADATHEGFDALVAGPARPPTRASRAPLDDVCLQLYTSGTTGLPKGVMLSNRNLFSFIEEVPKNWDFTPESVSHVVMPTFHIAGSGWGLVSLAMGSRMILDREVDPVAILKEVEAHGITHAIYVPAVLASSSRSCPTPTTTTSRRCSSSPTAPRPITEEVLRDAMAQFATAKFVQVYGLTETTGAVVQLDAVDHDPEGRPELLRSAGKPYPWIELRTVGADGEDVGPGRHRRGVDPGRAGDGRLLEQPRGDGQGHHRRTAGSARATPATSPRTATSTCTTG